MPDRKSLKVGDRIRLLRVPAGDLNQRARELQEGAEEAGRTADIIEWILALDPVVTISWIDEYEQPWFEYAISGDDGKIENHMLVIMEDESWCMA